MTHCASEFVPASAGWWPQTPSIAIKPPQALYAQLRRLRENIDSFELGHRANTWVRYGAATAAGTAVAGACGYAALHSFLPALVQVSQHPQGILGLVSSLPAVGTILHYVVGRGSVLGALSTSACWLGVINTLMLSEGRQGTLTSWTLAHAAIGVALAPLWLPGVAAAAPVMGTASGAALITSYALTGRLLSGHSTWQTTIVGTLGALAVGPMGAQLALGAAQSAVVGTALIFGAVGAALVGAFMLAYGWPTLTTDETAVLNRTRVDTDNALRLEMPGERCAGVFGLPAGLLQEIKACELNVREKMRLGLRCYLFSGAPGTGKTLMAQGIAKRLGAQLFAPRATAIKAQTSPSAYVMQLFDEARIRGRKSGRPVILFFDEAERLFENRADLRHGGAQDRTSHDLVLAFNEELDGVHRHTDLNMIVIAATNHESALDPSIRSRFFVRETLTAPQPNTIRKIFTTQLLHLQQTEAVARFGALNFSASALARWADEAQARELKGRDIKAVVTAALRQLGAEYVDAHPLPGGGAQTQARGASASWEQVDARLERAVDEQLRKCSNLSHATAAQPLSARRSFADAFGRTA